MVRSYNPFSRQWDQKTESSLNCLRDVFKDLPRLLIVADLFVTLPLQIPLNEHLKVEMVFQQAATQERVGVPLLHEHYKGQKKKKDPDADVYVHCGGNAGGQNVTRTFIFPGRATFLFAGFLIGVQQAPDTSRMSARQQVKENQNMEQHGR